MLGKFGIFAVIIALVFLFFIVISYGAGLFAKKKQNPEIKKYLKSVNILLVFIIIVGTILIFFL
jgi:O-antigen/teichoic acid export membrane protein